MLVVQHCMKWASTLLVVVCWNELARLAWQRNAESDLVTFGFDNRNRLVGQIRHPAELLDLKELDLFIWALARECDRFEYQLSGKDLF